MKVFHLFTVVALMSTVMACSKPAPTNAPAPTNTPAAANKPAATNTPAPANANASASANTNTPPAGGGAAGAVVTLQGTNLQFEVPAGWKNESMGDIVVLNSPDDAVHFMFMASDKATVEEAAKSIGNLEGIIEEAKMAGEPKPGDINGIPSVQVQGTGKDKGKDIEFSVDVVEAKKPVIIIAAGSKDGAMPHMEALAKLEKSIKKN